MSRRSRSRRLMRTSTSCTRQMRPTCSRMTRPIRRTAVRPYNPSSGPTCQARVPSYLICRASCPTTRPRPSLRPIAARRWRRRSMSFCPSVATTSGACGAIRNTAMPPASPPGSSSPIRATPPPPPSAQATSTLAHRCGIGTGNPTGIAGQAHLPITKNSRDPPNRGNISGRAPLPPASPPSDSPRRCASPRPGAGVRRVLPTPGPPRRAGGAGRDAPPAHSGPAPAPDRRSVLA
jgi:hypothetical protein